MWSDYYAIYIQVAETISLYVADNFSKTVLLEFIFYHTMTVQLEYIDCWLKICYSCILNTSYNAGIMLNTFIDPLCSKSCRHNRRVPN